MVSISGTMVLGVDEMYAERLFWYDNSKFNMTQWLSHPKPKISALDPRTPQSDNNISK